MGQPEHPQPQEVLPAFQFFIIRAMIPATTARSRRLMTTVAEFSAINDNTV
jgi:hypothetical protein